MIELEKTFKSGEGGFSTNPLTYTQIARKDGVAVYSRANGEKVKDYEVIVIRIIPKGTAIFQGPPSLDDEEKYAVTSSWGRCAWSFPSKYSALLKMEEVCTKKLNITVEAEEILIPVGEFVVNDVVTLNEIEYITASNFVKAQVANGSVIFVKEERRNLKGKPSRVYRKTT